MSARNYHTNVATAVHLQFSAGHRLLAPGHRCSHLHGHNYVAECHAVRERPADPGRPIRLDCDIVRERLKGWIVAHWDHRFIAWSGDDLMQHLVDENGEEAGIFFLPRQPSPENLAWYLCEVVGPAVLSDAGFGLTWVGINETANYGGWATVVPGGPE